MTPDQPRPTHGSKDPETGLFCWRDNKDYFRWVSLERFAELQGKRRGYKKKSLRKREARKKAVHAEVRSPKTVAREKIILDLHRRGKPLSYIVTLLNMKVSIIQKIINDSNQNNQ